MRSTVGPSGCVVGSEELLPLAQNDLMHTYMADIYPLRSRDLNGWDLARCYRDKVWIQQGL